MNISLYTTKNVYRQLVGTIQDDSPRGEISIWHNNQALQAIPAAMDLLYTSFLYNNSAECTISSSVVASNYPTIPISGFQSTVVISILSASLVFSLVLASYTLFPINDKKVGLVNK